MKIKVASGPALPSSKASLLVVPAHSEKSGAVVDGPWKSKLPKAAMAPLASGDFVGKAGSTCVIPLGPEARFERVLWVGLGAADEVSAEGLRVYGGHGGKTAAETSGGTGVVLMPKSGADLGPQERVRAVAEGLAMGAYSFDSYKSEKSSTPRIDNLKLVLEGAGSLAAARRASDAGQSVAYGVNLCRDLGNTPGNDLGPVEFATWARREGRRWGFKVQVLDQKALEREGMGAILGVAQGSARPPRLIVCEYDPDSGAKKARRRRPLAFVGKAITFDTGGISLKDPAGMQDMKFDMCGGGAVLGAMAAVGRLKPRRRIVGIIAAAENMPGGDAIRPGDVLTSGSGKTVEIINTDAEGRLVLADALHYAQRFDPELVVDLATLTGACVVALGSVQTGLFARETAVAERVREAGRRAGEKLWPMPLDDEYFELIRSDVADLKNSGGRWAGAISAAAFLARFIEGHPWAHLDIAGTGWTDRPGPYEKKGATGRGVRTLVSLATS